MRGAFAIALLLAGAACGPVGPNDQVTNRPDTRQQPSTLTPGVSLSGYANIGVKKQF